MIVLATPAPLESAGTASTAMTVSASLDSQGPSATWRSTSVRPTPAAREPPAWMVKMASDASAHLAPCPHSAFPQAILVPRNPAVMASATMRLEGSAVCVNLAGVALSAVRASLEMPVNPIPAGQAAPAPVMEWASAAPVPLVSRAISVSCCPPAPRIPVSMGATVSLLLASWLSAPAPLVGKAHDVSRMWMSVLAPHPVVPMVPAPTWQGVSAVPATRATVALPVIRTSMTVTPTPA